MCIAASVVMAFPLPAAAAASCSWSACDGKWPGEQGCRDDQKEVAYYEFFVDLQSSSSARIFYSPACRAAWGEFVINGSPPYLDIQLWAQPQYGGTKYLPLSPDGFNSTLVAGTTNIYRTVLASWEYSLKTCHSTYPFPDSDPEGDPEHGQCTPWT
jgi:hypothetical protein